MSIKPNFISFLFPLIGGFILLLLFNFFLLSQKNVQLSFSSNSLNPIVFINLLIIFLLFLFIFYIAMQRIILTNDRVIFKGMFLRKEALYSEISYIGIEERVEQGYRTHAPKRYLVIQGTNLKIDILIKPFGKNDIANVINTLHEKVPNAQINDLAQQIDNL